MPLLNWKPGDLVSLTLRYAYDSPEVPVPPSSAPPGSASPLQVNDRTVTYTYNDVWSLLSLLRDHPPDAIGPPDQYALRITNRYASDGNKGVASDTVVYLQVDLLPPGSKPGAASLPVPVFPPVAPVATVKPSRGEGI